MARIGELLAFSSNISLKKLSIAVRIAGLYTCINGLLYDWYPMRNERRDPAENRTRTSPLWLATFLAKAKLLDQKLVIKSVDWYGVETHGLVYGWKKRL